MGLCSPLRISLYVFNVDWIAKKYSGSDKIARQDNWVKVPSSWSILEKIINVIKEVARGIMYPNINPKSLLGISILDKKGLKVNIVLGRLRMYVITTIPILIVSKKPDCFKIKKYIIAQSGTSSSDKIINRIILKDKFCLFNGRDLSRISLK